MEFIKLTAPGGVLWKAWIAAHWERRLRRSDYLGPENKGPDVKGGLAVMSEKLGSMSLACVGHLILGFCRLLAWRARYLDDQANEVRAALRLSLETSGGLPVVAKRQLEEVTVRRAHYREAHRWEQQAALPLSLGDLEEPLLEMEEMELLPELEEEPEEAMQPEVPAAPGAPEVPEGVEERPAEEPVMEPAPLDLGEAPMEVDVPAAAPEEGAPAEGAEGAAQAAVPEAEAQAGGPKEGVLGGIGLLAGLGGFGGEQPEPTGFLGEGRQLPSGEPSTRRRPEQLTPDEEEALPAEEEREVLVGGAEETPDRPVARTLEFPTAGTSASSSRPERPSFLTAMLDYTYSPALLDEEEEGASEAEPGEDEAAGEGAEGEGAVAPAEEAPPPPPPKKRRRRLKQWFDRRTEIPVERYHNTTAITLPEAVQYEIFLPHRARGTPYTTPFSDMAQTLNRQLQLAVEVGERRREARQADRDARVAQLEAAGAAARERGEPLRRTPIPAAPFRRPPPTPTPPPPEVVPPTPEVPAPERLLGTPSPGGVPTDGPPSSRRPPSSRAPTPVVSPGGVRAIPPAETPDVPAVSPGPAPPSARAPSEAPLEGLEGQPPGFEAAPPGELFQGPGPAEDLPQFPGTPQIPGERLPEIPEEPLFQVPEAAPELPPPVADEAPAPFMRPAREAPVRDEAAEEERRKQAMLDRVVQEQKAHLQEELRAGSPDAERQLIPREHRANYRAFMNGILGRDPLPHDIVITQAATMTYESFKKLDGDDFIYAFPIEVRKGASFFELCKQPPRPTTAEVVARRFSSLLSQHMQGVLDLEQREKYGDIAISRGPNFVHEAPNVLVAAS